MMGQCEVILDIILEKKTTQRPLTLTVLILKKGTPANHFLVMPYES